MGELRVEHVPCFLHTEIQGEKIPDSPEGLPFTPEFLDALLASCPVVVEIVRDEDEPQHAGLFGRSEDGTLGLHRISNHHGRSYELSLGNPEDIGRPIAIWADADDNMYSSLSLKGNNFSRPHIQKSLTAPSGYIPHGLQETDSFLRVIRASRIMSEANIGTEKIIRVIEPQLVRAPAFDPETDTPIDGAFEYVPAMECKRRLLIQHWNDIADQPDAMDEFADVSKAINEMSFFITLRAMSVGSRILDLCGPVESFLPRLQHVFRVLDPVVEHEEGEGPLSVDNKEHIDWFFSVYLPTTIGTNMAKLHKLELMHTFPTAGNINALGDLIDLDSVKGAPLGLGDQELTGDDFFSDLQYFMHDNDNQNDLHSLTSNFISIMGDAYKPDMTYVDFAGADAEKLEAEKKKEIFLGLFKARLISSYIHERFNMEEDYDTAERDLVGLLDFIEIELKEGEGFGYDGYLKEILKHHLHSTAYETLIEESAQTRLTGEFIAWGTATAADRTMQIIMSRLRVHNTEHFDNDAELELGVFYETMALLHQEERIYRHNAAANYMEEADFTERLKRWIADNHKADSEFSRETVARAVTTGLRELIARKTFELAQKDPKNPGHKINFFAEQVARGLYTDENVRADVHGLLLDNSVCSVWAKVPFTAFEASVGTREEVTLIRHPDQPLADEITLASSDELRLQQVFHDGELIEDFHIRQHGEFGEGATLSFKPHPKATYTAWTMLDKSERVLHLFIASRN